MTRFGVFIFYFSVLAYSSSLFSQAPLNWTRDEINPGEDFTLTADESKFTEGLKSVRMRLNNGAIPYLVSDVFYVSPGAEYEFSIDVLDADTAGQVKIYADFYDTYGFDIYGEQPVFSTDSAEWQTIRWTGTVPLQAVVGYVLIKFYNQPSLYSFTKNAEIWMDRVMFRQPDSINLVVNGGFENWATGLDETWKNNGSLTISPNPAADYFQIGFPDDALEVIISDISGRIIYRENVLGKESTIINIQQFPEGLYVARAVLEDGTNLRRKLIVR